MGRGQASEVEGAVAGALARGSCKHPQAVTRFLNHAERVTAIECSLWRGTAVILSLTSAVVIHALVQVRHNHHARGEIDRDKDALVAGAFALIEALPLPVEVP